MKGGLAHGSWHAPLLIHPVLDCRAADKKLKPANFVKVRHILCEKQSKVRRRRWSVRLYAQLPLASGMCSGALFPSPAVSKVLDIPLQILEAQERIRNGEQFATVASGMSEDKARQVRSITQSKWF